MKITIQAIQLLRHILTTTGAKIMQQNNEVFEPRALSGKQRLYRREFFNATDNFISQLQSIEKDSLKPIKEYSKKYEYNLRKANPKITQDEINNLPAEQKLIELHNKRKNKINKFLNKKNTLKISDECKSFLNSLFKNYDKIHGFTAQQDVLVEEIEDIFKKL